MIRTIVSLLLSFFVSGITHAGGLGRLFFTAEQRKQLDSGEGQTAIVQPQPPAVQVLNGIVQRSDGTRTIWINGVAQIEDGKGKAPDVQMLIPPGKSQPVAVRVGQRLMSEQTAGE